MASEYRYTIDDHHWIFNKLNSSNFHSYNQGLFLLLCFTAILILLPSLFLCIHFCRRRFSHQPATTMGISPLPDQQWVKVEYKSHHTMLPSSTTKSFSIVGGGAEKKECCICLGLFQDNERLKVLTECQHAYHSDCLDMWLSAHPNCPLCRASLNVSNCPKKFPDVIN